MASSGRGLSDVVSVSFKGVYRDLLALEFRVLGQFVENLTPTS